MGKRTIRRGGDEARQEPRSHSAQESARPDVAEHYQSCSRQMFAAALRILDDHDSAWDAVHIVFSRLVRPGFSTDSLTPGYLIRAARNEALYLRRKATRSTRLLTRFADELEPPEHGPKESTEARQTLLARRVRALIGKLPPHQCCVLLLRLQGLQNEQIAAKLGVTVKTVEYHCARAFRSLRAELPRGSMYGVPLPGGGERE